MVALSPGLECTRSRARCAPPHPLLLLPVSGPFLSILLAEYSFSVDDAFPRLEKYFINLLALFLPLKFGSLVRWGGFPASVYL